MPAMSSTQAGKPGAATRRHCDLSSNRVVIGEEAFHEPLVDDGERPARRAVLAGEVAPANERQAERGEVAWADHHRPGSRLLLLLTNRTVHDVQPPLLSAEEAAAQSRSTPRRWSGTAPRRSASEA